MKFVCLAIASVASAAKLDPFHQNRQEAFQLLQSRQKRANGGGEEMMKGSNKERECIEETCNAEELAEYLENLPAYKKMARSLILSKAKEQLVDMKRQREIAQHKRESKCPMFGYQIPINDVNFQQVGDVVLKKAYTYDEEGYCSEPLDICQMYLDDKNERCVKKNQWCQNLNVEKNNVTKGWDFYVENGEDYLGYDCLCEGGYQKDDNDNCVKKASPCSFDPCKNQPNTTCKNLKTGAGPQLVDDGFECVCNEGFLKLSSSVGCQSVCKEGFVWNKDYGVCVLGQEESNDYNYGQQEIENIFN